MSRKFTEIIFSLMEGGFRLDGSNRNLRSIQSDVDFP